MLPSIEDMELRDGFYLSTGYAHVSLELAQCYDASERKSAPKPFSRHHYFFLLHGEQTFFCIWSTSNEVVASKQTSLLPGHSPPTGRQSRNHLDPRSSSSTFKPPVSVGPFLLAGFARPYGAYQSGPWFRRGGMPPIASGRLASGRWPPCSWPPTWPSPLLRTPQSPCPGATFS